MSLLARAHEALGARRASRDGYAQLHRDRNREQVVSWVTSTLGLTFLAGVVWCQHPGPPGRNLFLCLFRSAIRGRYSWPPDVDHADQIEVPGTVRIKCLADLAEAVGE